MSSEPAKSHQSDPAKPDFESSEFSSGEFSHCQLAREDPMLFSSLVVEYSHAVQLAVEESVFRTDRQVFVRIRNLARSAGEKDAVPQDLIFIHIAGLARIAKDTPRRLAKAYVQHARLLLVKMVGELALYYREQALAITKDAAQ
jgi:hypothetical protein